MTSVSTTPFNLTMLRKYNVWYSIKDGNWNDPSVWMSNGRKKHAYPQPGDDVCINHNVTANLVFAFVGTTYALRNLTVNKNGTFVWAFVGSGNFQINGNLQVYGTLDMTATNSNIFLSGVYNYIETFMTGTSSTVVYNAPFDQQIASVFYWSLRLTTVAAFQVTKYVTSNIIIYGNLSVDSSCTFQLSEYSLAVFGSTSVIGSGFSSVLNPTLQKSSDIGSLLFIGDVNFNTANKCLLSGSPNVEFRSGGMFTGWGVGIDLGTGTVTFSTNNQTISNNQGILYTINARIIISGAITVTFTGNDRCAFVNDVNGTLSLSTLKINGSIYITNPTLVLMTIGIFDYKGGPNATVGYVFNGDYTLPYTDFVGLYINGTGIKSLSGNTIITGSLTVDTGAKLEAGSYDLTITGTTAINYPTGSLSKLGAGALVFIGSVNFNTDNINFSGNPTIEFRNGGLFTHGIGPVHNDFGTGTITFTTNNQTIGSVVSGDSYGTIAFNSNIYIADGITVMMGHNAVVSGVINGLGLGSIFDVRSQIALLYTNSIAPMLLGKLYCNQAANTFIYGKIGDQDIQVPNDLTSGYYNLTLNGSGAKKLLGNISIKNTYTLTPPATLDTNGFSLTNP